jgi:MFS family permease
MSDEWPNKWLALFSSCYMCVVAGGIMYGWPSLLLMLQAEGQFEELCEGEPTPCPAQESLYHWIWTVSSSACLASNLLTGLLLDALGPRFSATVCSLLVLLGCVLIGMHDSVSCNTLLVGTLAGPWLQKRRSSSLIALVLPLSAFPMSAAHSLHPAATAPHVPSVPG